MTKSKLMAAGSAALALLAAGGASRAAAPAAFHPAYLHALHDIHLAYAAIESRGGGPTGHPNELAALNQLHAAADAIRQAAPEDNKDVRYVPSSDDSPGKIGPLHDAKSYIEKARADIAETESDAADRYLQQQALAAVNAADRSVDAAISYAASHPAGGGRSAPTPAAAHPAYLHALRDLKVAYNDIEHRGGDAALKPHEQAALGHLHAAADFIRQAAPDDAKNVADLPPPDKTANVSGLLHEAREYIQKARSDIHETESDVAARGLQQQALTEVDAAENSVNVAITDYQQHR